MFTFMKKMIYHPCVRNCCLNEQDICMGCFRHVNEIKAWQASTDNEKLHILQKAELRRIQKKNNPKKLS